MLISDYDFELPKELIAQKPLEKRESSRMLVVDRAAGSFADKRFADLPEMLKAGDLLVLNNTKVFPARLLGETETGAQIEVFLVEELETDRWITLARPGKRLKPGKRLDFGKQLGAEVVDKADDGRVIIQFDRTGSFDEVVESIGRTPLPPYIHRDSADADADRERYQTIFASQRGAIAAPTAGLHFSEPVFERLAERGVELAEITLHVGYGTFEPVRASDLNDHRVAPERFDISDRSAEKLERARQDGRRIIAVGTTTTRTLEYSLNRNGSFLAESGRADLTITPGYRFKAISGLLTNFHLPESSLLVLTATFGGHELIMKAYRHAVSSGYRFYSYGDCMLIA